MRKIASGRILAPAVSVHYPALIAIYGIVAAISFSPNIQAAPQRSNESGSRRISIQQVKELSEGGPGGTVEVEGVVTYFDAESNVCIVEDATGGIRVKVPDSDMRFDAGDSIKATGLTSRIDGSVMLRASMAQIQGTKELPSAPVVSVANLDVSHDCKRIAVRGTLRSILEDRGRGVYKLYEGGRTVTVRVNSLLKQPDFALIGRTLSLEGVCRVTLASSSGKPEFELLVPGSNLLHLRIAEGDEPTLPLITVERAKNARKGELVRVRLTITEFQPGKWLRGKDQTGELVALTELSASMIPGAVVELTGFAAQRDDEFILQDATYRRVGLIFSEKAVQGQVGSLPVIESAAAIRRLTISEAKLEYPVRLRGVITYYSTNGPMLFFQGATEGIFVLTGDQELDIKSGQLAVLKGTTGPGDFAPIVQNPVFEVQIDEAPMPDPPAVTFAEMMTGAQDSQWVKTKGIIRSVAQIENHLEITLTPSTGSGSLHVTVPHQPQERILALVPGSQIEVSGACGTDFNSLRQLAGVTLYCPNIRDLRVLNQAPSDPFASDLIPISSLFQFDPDRMTNRPVHVQGIVTYLSENFAFVQDLTGAIGIHSTLPLNLELGAGINVVGFPQISALERSIVEATVRKSPRLPTIAPVQISAKTVLDPNSGINGCLVTIDGTFLEQTGSTDQKRFLIQSGDFLFNATVPIQSVRQLGRIYPGTQLRLTGICSVQEDERGEPKSFRILLRSGSDVAITQKAPFWDSRLLRAAVGSLAGLIFIAITWAYTLNRRVKAQTELIQRNLGIQQQHERRFTEFAEHFPGTAFMKDARGRYLFANQAFAAVLGRASNEVVGKSDLELGPANWAQRRAEHDLQIKSTVGEHEIEEVFPSAPGRSWLTTRFCVSHSPEEQFICGIGVETTALKNLENQLMQAQKMESIGVLAGGVAHDFNNILTVIQAYASMLDSRDLPSEVVDSAQHICQAVTRAADLTRQLLTFSRKQPLRTATINLNEVAQDIFKMLERTLGEDICLELKLDTKDLLIDADKGMIEQVLVNLAVNSRDAMPRGGTFTVETSFQVITAEHLGSNPDSRPGKFVRLRVVDSGSGIAPENLKKIFEPFFTTKEVGRGTGLGLATVFGIVKQHSGWINVTSALRAGTTFEIFLPESIHAKQITRALSRPARSLSGTETILFVEDEAMLRVLMKKVLELDGYSVEVADCGQAALDILAKRDFKIDVIVTDIVMPGGMSGRELAAAIKKSRPEVPIILTSGYCSEINSQDLLVYPFLEKPYSVEKLLSAVKEALEKSLVKR